MRSAWLLLCLGGCQCLVPVDEHPDGGAVHDSGVPTTPECNKPNDCSGPFNAVEWCWGDGGVDWSCVDNRCVPQCQGQGGQTCATERSNECLKCPSTAACVAPDCHGARNIRWRLEQVSCRGVSLLQPGDVLHQASDGGGCGVPLMLERDGGSTLFGQMYLHDSYESSARIDAMGGTCLVSGLPTGVERIIFDCPQCQFVMANW